MSVQLVKSANEKITVPKILQMGKVGEQISMVTAYDATLSRIVDEAGVDVVLVGDSLGMVVQGHSNTLNVTIEDMVYHTKCVARGVKRALIMSDMPFLSYQVSYEEGVHNAGQLIRAGAESVKIEGGEEIADLVWYLAKIGIPVMAHVGLKPQSIHTMGGYRIQGRTKLDADTIVNDAKVLEEAGAFSILIEGLPLEVAKRITESVQIPTIGIGSGPHCKGQVLVCTDILGANPDFKPKFVKTYSNFYDTAKKAFSDFKKEVKDGSFPGEAHSFHRSLVEVAKE